MKLRNLICAGCCTLSLFSLAHAQTTAQHNIAFQDWLSSSGVSVSYIGQEGGVSGYLAKNGNRTQTIYVWPNNHDIIIGQMFNGSGDDITKRQISFLQQQAEQKKNGVDESFPKPESGKITSLNPSKIDGMKFAIDNHDDIQKIEVEGDGKQSPIGFVVTAPDKASVSQVVYVTPNGKMVIAGKHLVFDQDIDGKPKLEPIIDSAAKPEPTKDASQAATGNAPSVVQQGLPPQSSVAVMTGNVIDAANGLTPTPIMGPAAEPQEVPMDAFMSAVKGAAWLPIPAKPAPSAATLWFIADPASPATVAVWNQILPLIMAKKLAVHLILVDGSQQSITDNLAILGNKNPGAMWQSIIDGHAPPPIEPGNPNYQRATDWLNDNAAFVKSIHVNATPFLAYMGANMAFVSQLNPPNIPDFLSDLP